MASLLLALLVALPVSLMTVPAAPAGADSWAGWDAIDTIYYDSSQDYAVEHYLQKAAAELQDYLGQMAGRPFTVTTGYPPAPAIYLEVDAVMLAGRGEEAYRLVIDGGGINITGKTTFAARSGAYRFLESLGVKWLMKHPDWWIVPDSLPAIDAADFIDEPDYIYREVEFGPNPLYNREGSELWKIRNTCGGPVGYGLSHSYNQFMPASMYPQYPDAYLPPGEVPPASTTGWQLNPENLDVIDHAISWAETRAGEGGEFVNTYTQEVIPGYVIPITPNDNSPWGSYYQSNQQITDRVYGLANEVAEALNAAYPDFLIGVYNYSYYCEVPSISFTYPGNIYSEVATVYAHGTPLTHLQRIEGLKNHGFVVGIREYYDIPQWLHDKPPSAWNGDTRNTLNRMKSYYDAGATVYRAEGAESWGSAGFVYWIAAKKAWDTSLDTDELLDDFVTAAFGPAKVPMLRFYQRWLNGQYISENSLVAAVADLAEAESLASGDEDILARIKYQEYYMRYQWFYEQIDGMSLAELADFWSFATKLRDLYVLAFRFVDVDTFHDRLRDSFGMSEAQIESWMDQYADYTIPTAQEAAAWMAELQADFAGIEPIRTVEYIDPSTLDLRALGDTTSAELEGVKGKLADVLIKCEANDQVEAQLIRVVTNLDVTFYWKDPNGNILDSVTQRSTDPKEWTPQTLTASAGDGVYTISTYPEEYPYGGGVRVTSHPAAMKGSNMMLEAGDFYVYVPPGTEGFLIQFEPGHGYGGETVALYDPNGELCGSFTGPTTHYKTLGANYPELGLWRVHYAPDKYALVSMRIFGIPDLVWNDPENFAVENTGPAPPVLHNIGNKSGYVNSVLQFTLAAFDPNGDPLTYSASNLPSWASFDPATRAFTGTPDQVGTYTGVHFEVSDGTFTDFENITISVTRNPDVNGDGLINILDMISVAQRFNETGTGGWIAQDINNDGNIDVLDIMQVMQNWTG